MSKPKVPACFDCLTLGDHGHFFCRLPKGHDGQHEAFGSEDTMRWNPDLQRSQRASYEITFQWQYEIKGELFDDKD